MNPRICICCGEPMAQRGNALSRNPNMCASCSSLADGLDEDDELRWTRYTGAERHAGLATLDQPQQSDLKPEHFSDAFGE